MKATTYAKALRYMNAGAVEVLSQTENVIVTRVKGDTGTWLVVGDDNGYTCTCPAHTTCSHIIATEALVKP